MRFTRRRCAQAGMTTVYPVCARFTAPIITLPSSSIRMDTGSRRITVQPKPEVTYKQNELLPFATQKQRYTGMNTAAVFDALVKG